MGFKEYFRELPQKSYGRDTDVCGAISGRLPTAVVRQTAILSRVVCIQVKLRPIEQQTSGSTVCPAASVGSAGRLHRAERRCAARPLWIRLLRRRMTVSSSKAVCLWQKSKCPAIDRAHGSETTGFWLQTKVALAAVTAVEHKGTSALQ